MSQSLPHADRAAFPFADAYWLSGGFRPFFFLGAIAMVASILVWLPVFSGSLEVPTRFLPVEWHVHTLLFGGVSAIIAGFALTAVSNWTGRPLVSGGLLFALVVLWVIGRVAVSTSALLGPWPAAALDMLFSLALVFVFAREVIAGGNYRNLRIVALVAVFGLTNACFHLESALAGAADHSLRAAVAVVLAMIMLVGGRIIPAFTRNWLMMRGSDQLPAPFSRVDGGAMLMSVVALVSWIAWPEAGATGVLLVLAGLANSVRVARWRGLATRSEPLLFVLHAAYATIPAGFLLVGAGVLGVAAIDPLAMVHVWTAGTVGMMTLAVMTRASRGHSGRGIVAGRLELAIFVLVFAGALARVLAGFVPQEAMPLFHGAAGCWSLAYLLFAAGYFPMLFLRPRHR